jgi:hypothetical protein
MNMVQRKEDPNLTVQYYLEALNIMMAMWWDKKGQKH